jgi:hypothetical protein
MDNYGDSLAIIRYHVWWPSSSDPYYQYNTSENTTRTNYYSVSGVPTMKVDGNLDAGGYGNYENRINSELGIVSQIDLEIDGDFDPDSRDGELQITITATDSIRNSNLKLRIGLTQSDLYWHAPNGANWHHQTMRDMIPSAAGTAVTLYEGDILHRTQTFACPSPLAWEDCEIVVFIQSDSGRRIVQAGRRSLLSMVYTVDHFDLVSPVDHDTVETQNPQFTWTASADPDSAFPISYVVQISADQGFVGGVVSEPITDTTWTCTTALGVDSTYHWKVVASNGHAPERTSNQIYKVTIAEPQGGCQYVAGDINDNGQSNGIDVTFGVSYFKGGNAPPNICICPPFGEFCAAGDVNGNCVFNGIDITFLVGYFKGGQPELLSCPDCPPTR